ncbi:GtrA family protein [Candidatus Poriferisodalis sp.]|uniref:GtrA family protein n=1 Tax=Candidatus Poriferisodalis sp. TaxID=3101277 RepID=UPI003B5B82E4
MRWGFFGRLVGYSTVSAGTVVVTQAVLVVAYAVLGWPAVAANVVAVCVAAGPAYYANRRWVWSRTDRHSLTGEILPFWAYSLAGLGISSLLVALADRWWQSTVAVSAANLIGFGVLWAGKFILLDRVLFARPEVPAGGRPDARRAADAPEA